MNSPIFKGGLLHGSVELLAGTLLLVSLGGCPKSPPVIEAVNSAAPSSIAPEDAINNEALQAWARELIPLVEKHAGRSFTTPPEVEFFTDEAFRAFVSDESALIMDVLYKDTPPEVRQAKAEAEGQATIRGLFGKYGLFTGKVYIVKDSILAASKEGGVDRAIALTKIVLAHELTHALQADQHDGIAQLGALQDEEHFHGWSAVSEGGANVIALRVAKELGITDAFWSMCELQGWNQEGLLDPAAYPVWLRYGRGMAMLEEVIEHDGMNGFWAWHDAPPASSSMIFRPSTYSPELPERAVDYASLLRTTEQQLTRAEWLTSNTRLGEYTLRGEAIRTGKEAEFESVLTHLVDAQVLDLTLPDREADIRILAFDAPEPARSYLELLRAEQTIEGKYLAKKLGVTVEVSYTPVKDVEGDASLLRTQRVPVGDGRYSETRTAWVVRGADVVAVTAERFRPGLRLANTLNAVFERLDEQRPR